MPIEVLRPSSRDEWLSLRRQTIGASDMPALLGVHPFRSVFELYVEKSGQLTGDVDETPPMRRGRLLEPAAIELLREERPTWTVVANPIPGGEFYRDLDLGMSCTPDAFLVDPGREGRGIGQIKSVQSMVFNRTWINGDGSVEPPLYVVIQALQEAFLTGSTWAVAIALVVDFGVDLHVVDIPVHAKVIDRLRGEAKKFWKRVAEKDPPTINFEKDADTIRKLYPMADEGVTIDLCGNNRIMDLVVTRDGLKSRESDGAAATKIRKTIDAEILSILGTAAYGRLSDGRIISAKTTPVKGYTVEPSSYRTVKIKDAMGKDDLRSRIMARQ
jgi:YqaJ-like viral recombinase domain